MDAPGLRSRAASNSSQVVGEVLGTPPWSAVGVPTRDAITDACSSSVTAIHGCVSEASRQAANTTSGASPKRVAARARARRACCACGSEETAAKYASLARWKEPAASHPAPCSSRVARLEGLSAAATSNASAASSARAGPCVLMTLARKNAASQAFGSISSARRVAISAVDASASAASRWASAPLASPARASCFASRTSCATSGCAADACSPSRQRASLMQGEWRAPIAAMSLTHAVALR
eukprot:scaffold18060_cov31-Tisochrysis_lutea.AAC.1